jgi:hypothetical protein
MMVVVKLTSLIFVLRVLNYCIIPTIYFKKKNQQLARYIKLIYRKINSIINLTQKIVEVV